MDQCTSISRSTSTVTKYGTVKKYDVVSVIASLVSDSTRSDDNYDQMNDVSLAFVEFGLLTAFIFFK